LGFWVFCKIVGRFKNTSPLQFLHNFFYIFFKNGGGIKITEKDFFFGKTLDITKDFSIVRIMKWQYIVLTKDFHFTNMSGDRTFKKGWVKAMRYPDYLVKEGALIEGLVAYKMHELITNDHFVVVYGAAEAKALAAEILAE
jgi:hypothetical protein